MTGEDVLWDDEGFRQRVETACKLRGLALRDVLVRAGASRYYLNKKVEGRSTNVVMKLARVLEVSPEALAFGIAAPDQAHAAAEAGQGLDVAGHFDAESLRRLIATMFTAQQVMALLYLALNQKEANLETVADLVLKAAHGGQAPPHDETTSSAASPAPSTGSSSAAGPSGDGGSDIGSPFSVPSAEFSAAMLGVNTK